MNKKLKQGLMSAFDAPQPVGKAGFLKTFAYPKASGWDFFISQIGYIRKRVWICSVTLFALSAFVLYFYNAPLDFVWAVSSAFPFLALVAMSEVTRSCFYGMAELEVSCKHTLSQVTLIRLIVLGVMNSLILLAFLLSFIGKTDFGFFRLGTYLLMPFLINSYALLLLANRFAGRETMYASAIITGFISLLSIFFTTQWSVIFADRYVPFWIFALVLLIITSTTEIVKLFKRTEESDWNLVLTA